MTLLVGFVVLTPFKNIFPCFGVVLASGLAGIYNFLEFGAARSFIYIVLFRIYNHM